MNTTTNRAHAEGSQASKPGRWTLPWAVGYLVLALACLIQWGMPSPWSRLDLFSGGYLALRALPVLPSFRRRRVRVSAECQRERWGSTAAPGWVKWAVVLTVADLGVFLDYGHWHLVPGLERRSAQAFGLLVYLGVAGWQKWTDRHLEAAFGGQTLRPRLTQSGPFGYVRHPRYAGTLAGKVAAALVFASVLGWLQVVLWSILLRRQIRMEEAHLRELFGREYAEYSQHTAKLIPGIY